MDEIDRELASLLSVEASPEFRARVRARVASEPAPRSRLQFYVVIAGAAATSVVIAIAVGSLSRRPHDLPAEIAVVTPHPEVPGGVDAASTPAPRIAAPAVQPRPPRRNELRVQVAQSEVRGLRQLVSIVNEGRTRFVFSDEYAPNVEREPARDIVIAPIAIAPIEVAASSEFSVNAEGDEQ